MRLTLSLLSCLALGVATCCGGRVEMYRSTRAHRFETYLNSQIEAAWKRAIGPKADMVTLGTVRVALTALPNGKISQLKVLSNTSNDALATIAMRALWSVKILPIPSELLSQGKFTKQFSFTVFAKRGT
jgi:outer membrane biosynthesis protein TonB